MKICVLFDLDGTLLDTLEDLTDGVNYALACFGLPQRTLEEIRSFIGNGAGLLIQRASGNAENWREIFACYKEYYDSHCQIKTKPYHGVLEAIQQLQQEYPIAIVSNKQDEAVKMLCADYFPGVYALGETSDCPRKPAPDMLRKAMAAVGADRCVYVGDSEVDIITAENVGCPCVSVVWGFRDENTLRQYGAKYCCGDARLLPNDIKNAIKEYYG